jgi:short-subunit dehydrogenase
LTQKENQVVLITGASSGIGKATAVTLARNGYRVYGTSRNPKTDPTQDIMNGDASPGFFKMIQLDVCDDTSTEAAVDFVMKAEGRLDVLINNAGFGMAGPIEEMTMEEVYSQLNTNFFGVVRMCRQAIPIMRKQKSGIIINIGSVAGLFSIPFQSMYSVSKYAIEAYTEALRIEVKPFGIHAVVIEPGDTKTGFTDARNISKSAESSTYGERFTRSVTKMAKDEQSGPGPEIVAKTILGVLNKKNPPIRITVGFDYKVLVFLKRLLPSRLVEYILSKMYA